MAPRRKKPRLETQAGVDDDAPLDVAEESSPSLEEEKRTPAKESHHQQRQLFVRSLPPTTTNETLTHHFSESYPLRHATVVLDPATKQSKGYGFVTFADADDAQRAKEEFDGSLFEGRKIRVEVAEHRHRDPEAANGAAGSRREASSSAVSAKAKAAEREMAKQQAKQPPKLIIRNLPWTISEPEQLAVLFRSYGKVKHATIPKKKTGLMSGFGFVVMRGRKNAEKALQCVNGKVVDDRTLAVDWAVEKSVWEGTQGEQEEGNKVEQGNGKAADGSVDEDEDIVIDEEEELEEEEEENGMDVDEQIEESDGDVDELEEDSELDGSLESEDGNKPTISGASKVQDNFSTIFIRNVPFTSDDDLIFGHFGRFGPVRYARVVLDHTTERPKGTAFVCFYNQADADLCVREAPRLQDSNPQATRGKPADGMKPLAKHSLLENDLADPSGRYTLEGRILQVSRAVDKREAFRLTEEGHSFRDRRDKDRRRLYLLSEGTIPSNSPLYNALAPSEVSLRDASLKQRKALIQSNPSLHLSLTRLSIRNMPRSITSKDLKALAREAVVGFAKDVKAGKRQQLSKEESKRGGEEMSIAEKARKARGKGIVKQAKIVFEGREGGKVSEESGAGRSRGYGFIEYSSHRWALMGLRWLNGHLVQPRTSNQGQAGQGQDATERKKRFIVEFAIENAQVVARRKEREVKEKEQNTQDRTRGKFNDNASAKVGGASTKTPKKPITDNSRGTKRSRSDLKGNVKPKDFGHKSGKAPISSFAADAKQKTNGSSDPKPPTKREEIIARKRMAKRSAKKRPRA